VINGPLKWYTVAARLRDAVYAELTAKPDRSGVVPGAIAWDECDCGMLAISIARVFTSDVFPEELTTKEGAAVCDAAWEVGELVIQIIRCAPSPEGQSVAPSVAALDASAQEVARDAYETLLAATSELCQMRAVSDIDDFFISPQVAQGPSGSCVGSELRALVSLPRN
jgi:hypothetical protein